MTRRSTPNLMAGFDLHSSRIPVHNACVEGPTVIARLQLPRGVESAWMFFSNMRHNRTYVPIWQDNAYGRISRGLFWEADSAWRRYRRLHHLWASFHYVLGTLSVTLAAVSGFGGLSELLNPKQSAVVAISSAIIGALATFLSSDKKRVENASLASAWDSFRDDVTLLYDTRPASNSENGSPAAGWEQIAHSLQSRAKELRSGKSETALAASSWPDATSATADRSSP